MQPARLLVLLVERRGELVTREELRAQLWPGDTFGDFDHGLNNAVNRLREALGDSAASPRYIQTAPRRGYRFIADLEVVAPARVGEADATLRGESTTDEERGTTAVSDGEEQDASDRRAAAGATVLCRPYGAPCVVGAFSQCFRAGLCFCRPWRDSGTRRGNGFWGRLLAAVRPRTIQ